MRTARVAQDDPGLGSRRFLKPSDFQEGFSRELITTFQQFSPEQRLPKGYSLVAFVEVTMIPALGKYEVSGSEIAFAVVRKGRKGRAGSVLVSSLRRIHETPANGTLERAIRVYGLSQLSAALAAVRG